MPIPDPTVNRVENAIEKSRKNFLLAMKSETPSFSSTASEICRRYETIDLQLIIDCSHPKVIPILPRAGPMKKKHRMRSTNCPQDTQSVVASDNSEPVCIAQSIRLLIDCVDRFLKFPKLRLMRSSSINDPKDVEMK
jgi:hypothetical protein